MRRKLAAAAVLSLVCAAAAAGQGYVFRGETIQDPRTGLTIMGERADRVVAVTSPKHHYSLVLPWTEDWKLDAEGEALLRGTSGLVNVTLRTERCEDSPEDHLRALAQRLRDRTKGLEKIELVTHRKEPVLRVVVDAAAATGERRFAGTRMVHLHTAKRWKDTMYVLHLSRVVPPDEARSFDEKELLNMAALGFQVDFMREG